MAQKENNGLPQGLGDITMIRDILMGREINEYERRFALVDEKINQLEANLNEQMATLRADMNARFDKLEALMAQNVDTLNQKLQNTSAGDKQMLSQLFADLSKKMAQ